MFLVKLIQYSSSVKEIKRKIVETVAIFDRSSVAKTKKRVTSMGRLGCVSTEALWKGAFKVFLLIEFEWLIISILFTEFWDMMIESILWPPCFFWLTLSICRIRNTCKMLSGWLENKHTNMWMGFHVTGSPSASK